MRSIVPNSNFFKVFLFIFCFTGVDILAQGSEIKGRIITQAGKPIADAVVLERAGGRKTLSGKDGYFHLEVPAAEKILLEIIHPDFMEKQISIPRKDLGKTVLIQLIPSFLQKEEVTVTAFRYPEASASIPAAEAVMAKENIEENMPSNVAEGVLELPGVSNMGAGGFSLVPNIRGLARRRILLLLDNARITSERRTGPSASFVNPMDIEKIEVLRSPSSVFYGSDAIGGVIRIITRKPSLNGRLKGSLHAKYGTNNQEKNIGFNIEGGTEKTGYMLSLQGVDAENGSSPRGKTLQSFYSQASLMGQFYHRSDKREIRLSFLGARGYGIGKANQDSASKPTQYPREARNFVQLSWKEKPVGKRGEIDFQVFLNPQFLETKKEKILTYKKSESFSRTQGLDFGMFLSYRKKFGKISLSGGADLFGRRGVQASGWTKKYEESGIMADYSENMPYKSGRRSDGGLFLSADYSGVNNVDLVGGARFDFVSLKARPGGTGVYSSSSYKALTGFLGGSIRIFPRIILFANVSRAYRVPSISELFYSGITGRGAIIAQAGLKPETSLNIDGGIRFFAEKAFIGIYAFSYKIDHLIERYIVEPRVYTYGNVNTGRLSGYEIEFECYPKSGWRIFGNYFSFKGKSLNSLDRLNDVPAPRLYIGTQFWMGRLSIGANARLQQKKTDPGPAEVIIPGYIVVNLKANYLLGSSFRLFAILSNCLQKTYIARPDPDAIFEPGRNFQLGMSCQF